MWQATALQAQAGSSLRGFGSETRRRGCTQRPSCASRVANTPDHVEGICLQRRRLGFDPWVRKIPWRRQWQPTPVPLPGKSNGQTSLVGYSLRGHKESDTTERLHFHFSLSLSNSEMNPAKESESPYTFLQEPPVFPGSMAWILSLGFLMPLTGLTGSFLCVLGPLSEKQEALMTKSPASNTRRPEDRDLGPMWPVTQRLLRDFYGPFNARLAQVLADEAFLWRKT